MKDIKKYINESKETNVKYIIKDIEHNDYFKSSGLVNQKLSDKQIAWVKKLSDATLFNNEQDAQDTIKNIKSIFNDINAEVNKVKITIELSI
jgi:hypothetical protein